MINNIDVFTAGRSFELNKSISDRKEKGVFYTPEAIVDSVVEELLGDISLSDNPYIKILDPACGAGYFVLKAFSKMVDRFAADFDEIMVRNPELRNKVTRNSIGVFIAENNIWGADVDPEAVELVKAQIYHIAGIRCDTNIFCCDSLVEDEQDTGRLWEIEYDYIIGNPPYIGHKGVTTEYKKQLQQLYKGIYRDKSDISYCFIKKGIDLLKKGGKLSYIISRYFMEGPSAKGLRGFIDENSTVLSVTDFFGKQVFEDAGVDVCILTLEKDIKRSETRIVRHSYGEKGAESYTVGRDQLGAEGWLLAAPAKYEIFKVVQEKSTHSVDEMFDSYQGIITGCDKAFVLDGDAVEEYGIEKELLKPWIKNSDIERYGVKTPRYSLIYSDLIDDESKYPNALKYIERHREKLMNRRECKKGFRKWYQLQWGRKQEIFESGKLVYPYKASSNRFAVDEAGCYCSADVYSLIIKNSFKSYIAYECLCAALNSKLVEFYFKCYAKKMSGSLYDYYPNTVLRIRLNAEEIMTQLDSLSKLLRKSNCREEKQHAAKLIDSEMYKIYGLSDKQIEMIEKDIGDRWL